MSAFVIGDLQGCLNNLDQLLSSLPITGEDELWLCGDLINRGPDSLGALRFLKAYPGRLRCVLGNHDLAVLAHASGRVDKCGSTARELLAAPDGPELLHWLQQQDLLVQDAGLVMVHAGLPPAWSIETAKAEARRVEAQLRDAEKASALFEQMYGDEPAAWDDSLQGIGRTRYAINAFTRMRFVRPDGAMEFATKSGLESGTSNGLIPWFAHPRRKSRAQPIAFGHWSTLRDRQFPADNVWALDSGCVWGGSLTALQWPERRLWSQPCPRHQQPGVND